MNKATQVHDSNFLAPNEKMSNRKMSNDRELKAALLRFMAPEA